MNNNPKVFISYSHDSQSHKDWVRQLAADLRDKGTDAILDQWELKLGDDLAAFMEAGVSGADRVIAICSENYVRKADAGEAGVGYEKIIVTGELVKNIGTNKFIPLVRANKARNKVPICLSSRVYIDFENDSNYQNKLMELLRDIYGEPKYLKPPLGSNPFETRETPQVSADITNNTLSSQEAPTLDPNWTTNHSNTAHRTAKEHKFNSLWELNAKVVGHDLNVSQNILLECARKSEIRTFGWPIGVILGNRDEYKPRPSSNGIFANIQIGERETFDYWAWSQWGEFYLLKSLFEDRRSPGEIYFNTRIVRTTECLLYLRNMYENINVPLEKSIIINSKYEGISNRAITSSNPNRLMFENRKIADNEASCEIAVTLQQLNEDIVNCVKGLLAPLFILFDFFELKDEIYADIVNRFINGEAS